MKTFGNGRKALQRNVLGHGNWRKSTLHENIWQWKKGIAKECQVVTIVQLHIWKNDQQGVSKVSERCQQGVNKLSTRCQICNHLPMKNMQVILSVFVCRQKIIFVFVFAFVIFWREGRGPKKNILKKWRGEPKCGFLIIEQSLRPTNTLRECNIIKLIDY